MTTAKKIDIHELSQSERILLAEELWDSIAEDQDSIEVSEAQMELIRHRLAAYKASPNEGTTWEEVKKDME